MLSQVRHALAIQKEDMQLECKEITQARGPTLFVTRTRFSDILPSPHFCLLAVEWSRRSWNQTPGILFSPAGVLAADKLSKEKNARRLASTTARVLNRWTL